MAVRYTYGNSNWRDLLTAWNGNAISSDAIGNMRSDGTRTYTWRNGRELATVTKGGVTWTNTYNADGIRTKRTTGSNTYSYIYNGGSLSQMTVDGTVMNFAYDASGTPMALTYGGATYYYATNIQGDVVAILNASGTAVVTYTYDAWGNILTTTGTLASTLGQLNPLRYRGYVYDPETGLYYLQSRYYNPQMGRFICADSLVSTGQGILGNNMFAYCNNNPISYSDPRGSFPTDAETVHHRLDGNIGKNTPLDDYIEIKSKFEAAGIILHYTKESALLEWSKQYLPLSAEYEYVTYLYSIDTAFGKRYFTTQTFKGTKQGAIFSANVLVGTTILALHDTISSAELLAHVHTHPKPPKGYHNDFPSNSQNIYGGDRIVFELLNLPEMYIFPYAPCPGTPSMIVYSDPSTWCPYY